MIYYIIHHVLPETDTFTAGKRNCATFLLGTIIYGVLYAVLKNFQIIYGVFMEAVLSVFAVMIFADMCTMGYIYKRYYGRNILYEVSAEGEDKKWNFDKDTHKYTKKSYSELLAMKLEDDKKTIIMKEIYDKQIADLKAKIKGLKRKCKIVALKEKIRAAVVIQNWWRDKLYKPPNGILYLRAKTHFDELASTCVP